MPVLPALLLVLAIAPPLPPAPRAPAASGAPAAQVVVVQGNVEARAGKASFKLARGTLLEGTDVLTVSEGAWVALLLLNNGHVVRLDDDLTIAVDKLALFKAGPVKDDAQAQLDRLLSRREKEGLGNERLIGWHQGLAAANTLAAASAKEEESRPERKRAAGSDGLGLVGSGPGGGGRGGGGFGKAPPGAPPPPTAQSAPLPPAKAAPPPPPPPPTQGGESDEAVRRPTGHGAERKKAGPQAERREPPAAPSPAVAKADLDDVAGFAVDVGLKRCVAEVAGALDAPVRQALGPAVKLRFRLSDDEVQVSTGGALPLHPCLAAWAQAHRAQLDATWKPLLVPLK